jgi:hypothetical protein
LKIVGIFEKDGKFLKKWELEKKVGNIWEFWKHWDILIIVENF